MTETVKQRIHDTFRRMIGSLEPIILRKGIRQLAFMAAYGRHFSNEKALKETVILFNKLSNANLFELDQSYRDGLEFVITVHNIIKSGITDYSPAIDLRLMKIFYKVNRFNRFPVYYFADQHTMIEAVAMPALWLRNNSLRDLSWRQRMIGMLDEIDHMLHLHMGALYQPSMLTGHHLADMTFFVKAMHEAKLFPHRTSRLLKELSKALKGLAVENPSRTVGLIILGESDNFLTEIDDLSLSEVAWQAYLYSNKNLTEALAARCNVMNHLSLEQALILLC